MDIKNIYVCKAEQIQSALHEARLAKAQNKYSKINIILKEGEYRVNSLVLSKEDSGSASCPICFKGEGDVTLTGGSSLDIHDFKPVSGNAHQRLCEDAKSHVLEYDLAAHGITREEIGEFGAMRLASTVQQYDDYIPTANCELFWNNKRMSICQYPTNGYTKIDDVFEVGDCGEFPPQNYDREFGKKRNPKGFSFYVSKEDNEHIKNWQQPEIAWVNGYFFHDWSDGSSQIARVETRLRRIFMKHSSHYGVRKGMDICFVNVLEELDSPGEFYIDRDTMMLYIYPMDDCENPRITILLSLEPVIQANDIEYVSFENLTVECTRSNAIEITGSNCGIIGCTIRNVTKDALHINGYNNLIDNCDISHTGAGGISVTGGDRPTLTSANNIVQNNYIHDWAEITQMYTPGISTSGCGNIIRHNEITRAPHMAIYYFGNNHIIEYNHIHEVVQYSNDAGAIYSGFDLCGHGSVVRYNLLENIGNANFHPNGIYWDDMLSGQTAYGNIIFNVDNGNGFLIGGGRNNTVYNNIVLKCQIPIYYDTRGRDAIVHDGWFSHARDKNDRLWKTLDMFYDNKDIWMKHFPELDIVVTDFDESENPNFAMNPKATIKNNVLVYTENPKWAIYHGHRDEFSKFNTKGVNPSYPSMDDCIEGKYSIKDSVKALIPDFEDIPPEKIGRNKQ